MLADAIFAASGGERIAAQTMNAGPGKVSREAHTPGPWIADSVNTQDDAVTAVWQNDGRSDYYLRTSQVCECFWDSGEDLEIGDNRPVSLAEAEANAKLIASAPELLEALKGLLSSLEESGPWSGPNITAARAAIAKATT